MFKVGSECVGRRASAGVFHVHDSVVVRDVFDRDVLSSIRHHEHPDLLRIDHVFERFVCILPDADGLCVDGANVQESIWNGVGGVGGYDVWVGDCIVVGFPGLVVYLVLRVGVCDGVVVVLFLVCEVSSDILGGGAEDIIDIACVEDEQNSSSCDR